MNSDNMSDRLLSRFSFLAKLLDLSNEAIFAWELYGSVIYWNKGAEKIYGYGSSEAVGSVSHALLKTEHPNGLVETISSLEQNGSWEGEVLHTARDGRVLVIETKQQVMIDDSGKPIVLETNRDITERKKSEKEAFENYAKFEAAMESMMDAFCIADYNGTFIHFNDAFATFYRFKSKNECFTTLREYYELLEVFTPDGMPVPSNQRIYPRTLRGETGSYEEFILRRRDSGETWIGSYSFGPIKNVNGLIIGYLVICRDITDQKHKDEELRKTHKRNTEILESISDGFFTLDKNWRYTYINRRAANNVGYEPDQLIHQNIWTKFKELKGSIVESNFRRAMQGQEPISFEFSGVLTDSYYQCSVYPTREGISVYWVDITERKLVEMQLAETKAQTEQQAQQLNTILENMSEGVLIIDKNQNIIHMNPSGRMMHRFDSKIFNDFKKFRDIYHITYLNGGPVPKEELPIERAARGETFVDYNLVLRRKDTNAEWIGSYNGIPIYDGNGDFNMAILTLRDITEHIKHLELLYRAEAEKEKREVLEKAIEVKDDFLSLVSHEFKTPITIINSAIQVMEQVCKDDLSPKAKGYLKKIRQNSFRQLRLVNHILELTGITGGHDKIIRHHIDLVFLTDAIVESVMLYAQQKGITLNFICPAKQKTAWIDDEKYERILLNLLSNAIKFTPEGKSVTVSLKFYKEQVSLIVKDEGIGIPNDKLQYIFERFGRIDSSLTRKTEGTGIGLSLVKLLSESLGGSVNVKSKIGIGSTFIVKLPIVNTQEVQIKASSQETISSRVHQITEIELSDIYL